MSVVAGSQEKNRGKYDVSFSATQVIDVDFSVVFTPGAANRFGGDHVVEFRVYTPSGALYQSIAVPFSSDAKNRGAQKKLDGYPRAMPTQILQDVTTTAGKGLATSVRLPVAGTPIIQNSLYGKWKAEAYVDGETVSCAKPLEFTITQ
jgi:hypothetical protein